MGENGQARQPLDSAFRHIVECLPAGAYTCDADGLITYFNQRAVALWGRTPKLNDPVDRYCGSFKLFTTAGEPIPHDDCWMARALKEGKDYDGEEIVIERPDGSRWTALAHASPLLDPYRRIAGAVNVLVDISQCRRAEEELRQVDRRRSDFLALLAHELRNPLAPLRNGLQILRLAGDNTAAALEARAMMERQLEQMMRLIDELLDLSRISNGKILLEKERLDLAAVVQHAVEMARPLIDSSGHRLFIQLPRDPVFVDADRARLAQVLANLLNNAAKFTERGGKITLSIEPQGADVLVRVRDTGIGIAAEMLPRIFDLFTQADRSLERSQGGLGIGLSLVRRLVEMHGGRVEAHSEGLGQGSEFIVRLPVVLSPAADVLPENKGLSSESSKYRILVVDDNKDTAKSLSMLLAFAGHETSTAHDGFEAVEAARQFRPEVILLDISLPKMNGYDACRTIRAQPWGKDMTLIALTGWGQEEDKHESKKAGFDFHMVKPIKLGDFERLLEGLLLTPA